MLSKNLSPRQRDQAVAKAQGLATFMLQHGIAEDVVEFVLGVHKLVPADYPINWKVWLCVPGTACRPPLWWRVLMLIAEADAVGGKRYKLQSAPHFVYSNTVSSGVVEVENQKRIPNLDIWTWDTAVALQILWISHLFNSKINEVARKTIAQFRNELSHFNVYRKHR